MGEAACQVRHAARLPLRTIRKWSIFRLSMEVMRTRRQGYSDAGRLRNNLKLSEAQKQEQVFAYQRTIKQAFQSVSDALIGLQKFREFREQEANLTASAEDARLARLRYNGGSTSYLEVLTNDTNYYTAQLNLAVAQENEALSIVQLYRSAVIDGRWNATLDSADGGLHGKGPCRMCPIALLGIR